MSTRSAIIFVGANNYDGTGTKAVRLYQHCDGYPSHVLPLLQSTLKAVKVKAEEHWDHISYRFPRDEFDFLRVPIHAELMAGVYIAENTSGFGMGARVEEIQYLESDNFGAWDDETRLKIFGNQADLEWVYVVNSIDRSIKVFGGGYTGDAAWELPTKGLADPLSYVEHLVEKFQEPTAKRITKASRALNRLGFPVNPRRQSERRAAQAERRAKYRQK